MTIEFYNPFKLMSFTYDKCFLCGKPLTNENKSDEHVFPKWLQNKYRLWDQVIHLLNRTTIPYRQLTVPCCTDCNMVHLSALENDIKFAVDLGFDEFIKLDELKIYQWLLKIFYGLLFKELSLLIDRKDPERGQITNPELLSRFKTLHGFLQSVRLPFNFAPAKPWSIFIVNTFQYPEPENNFDYHDGIVGITFSIRMGDIGIIAALEDGGAQKVMFNDYFACLNGIKLHPIQFNEMAAKVAYKAMLLNRVPKYCIMLPSEASETVYVIMANIQGFSSAPIYNQWDQKTYARLFASYLFVLNFLLKISTENLIK